MYQSNNMRSHQGGGWLLTQPIKTRTSNRCSLKQDQIREHKKQTTRDVVWSPLYPPSCFFFFCCHSCTISISSSLFRCPRPRSMTCSRSRKLVPIARYLIDRWSCFILRTPPRERTRIHIPVSSGSLMTHYVTGCISIPSIVFKIEPGPKPIKVWVHGLMGWIGSSMG